MALTDEITRLGASIFMNKDGVLVFPQDWAVNDRIGTSMPDAQDLYAESSTQLYPIGTQLRKGGKLYRYSKAVEALTAAGFLKMNSVQCPGLGGNSATSGFEGAAGANVAANGTSFTITDTDAAKNLYENAHLVTYGTPFENYPIIGNDISNGTTTTLYVGAPGVKTAFTTSVGITVYLNPYARVGASTSYSPNYYSALGYVQFAVTINYFFWLQTAGMVSGITGASTWPGQTAYQRECYSNTDGSLIGKTATTYLYQRVGYLLAGTSSSYGDNFIMLQLDQ